MDKKKKLAKKLDKAIEAVASDPAKMKREYMERARREQPHLTDKQLENLWDQSVDQLGL